MGYWPVLINCSVIVGDLETWAGIIPVIVESVETAFKFGMQTVPTVWRSEECEVDRDLDKNDLKASYGPRVYADSTLFSTSYSSLAMSPHQATV